MSSKQRHTYNPSTNTKEVNGKDQFNNTQEYISPNPFNELPKVKNQYNKNGDINAQGGNTNHRSIMENSNDSESRIYYRFKFILLGEVSVGKTCIAVKFVNNEFYDKYVCTVGVEFKLKTLNLSSSISADLQIWDTCGQERFRSITRQYYRDSHGIMLVFDLTSSKSFLEIEHWLEEINSNLVNKNDMTILLVGNKCDLLTERQVSYTEASKFAKKHLIDYIEVSAKEGINIYEAFENLAWNVVHKEEAHPRSNFNVADKSRRSEGSGVKTNNVAIKNYIQTNEQKKKNCC